MNEYTEISQQNPDQWHKGQTIRLTSNKGAQGEYILRDRLGAGKTSLVWKAVRTSDQKEVALKILRTPVLDEDRQLLRDEFSVLNRLHLRFEQLHISPENRPIPELYDWELRGEIPYLAMEVAPGKTVAEYVQSRFALLPTAETASAKLEGWRKSLNQAVVKLQEQGAGEDPHLEQALREGLKFADTARNQWEQLLPEINALDARQHQKSLQESEILLVGYQACRVFSLLHEELQRSYKDFQFKNFYLDRERQQLKIIDWNVLTAEGDVERKIDLFRLSAGLYYLITQVKLETPEKPQNLARRGGVAWEVFPSPGLRLILERALAPQTDVPYESAYDWEQGQKPGYLPLEEITSLGNALEMLGRYHTVCTSVQLENLLYEVEDWMRADKFQSVQAMLGVIQRHQDSPFVKKASARIDQLTKTLKTRLTLSPDVDRESLYGWLVTADDPQKAKDRLEGQLSRHPDSLSLHRWGCLINAAIQMTPIQRQEYRKDIPEFLKALEAQRWETAARLSQKFSAQYNFNPLHHLVKDLEVSQDLARLGELVDVLEDESTLKEGFSILERINDAVAAKHPAYLDLILAAWPDYPEWKARLSEQATSSKKGINPFASLEQTKRTQPFETWCDTFQSLLSRYRGHPNGMTLALDEILYYLQQGQPAKANQLASLALDYAAHSSFLVRLQNLQRWAAIWAQVDIALASKNWLFAQEFLFQLKLSLENSSEPTTSLILETLKAQASKIWEGEISRLEKVAEIENENRQINYLEEALARASEVLELYPNGNLGTRRQTIQTRLDTLKKNAAEKDQQLVREKAQRDAHLLKAEAESLLNSLVREDLETAKTKYEKAATAYGEAGDEKAYQDIEQHIIAVKQKLENLASLQKYVEEAEEKLEVLETMNSQNLTPTQEQFLSNTSSLFQTWMQYSQIPELQALILRALAVAQRSFTWTKEQTEEVWKTGKLPGPNEDQGDNWVQLISSLTHLQGLVLNIFQGLRKFLVWMLIGLILITFATSILIVKAFLPVSGPVPSPTLEFTAEPTSPILEDTPTAIVVSTPDATVIAQNIQETLVALAPAQTVSVQNAVATGIQETQVALAPAQTSTFEAAVTATLENYVQGIEQNIKDELAQAVQITLGSKNKVLFFDKQDKDENKLLTIYENHNLIFVVKSYLNGTYDRFYGYVNVWVKQEDILVLGDLQPGYLYNLPPDGADSPTTLPIYNASHSTEPAGFLQHQAQFSVTIVGEDGWREIRIEGMIYDDGSEGINPESLQIPTVTPTP